MLPQSGVLLTERSLQNFGAPPNGIDVYLMHQSP